MLLLLILSLSLADPSCGLDEIASGVPSGLATACSSYPDGSALPARYQPVPPISLTPEVRSRMLAVRPTLYDGYHVMEWRALFGIIFPSIILWFWALARRGKRWRRWWAYVLLLFVGCEVLYWISDYTCYQNYGEQRLAVRVLAYLLKAFTVESAKIDLRYWLQGGSLLAAVRDGGHAFDWEYDVDVSYLAEDTVRIAALAEPLAANWGVELVNLPGKRSLGGYRLCFGLTPDPVHKWAGKAFMQRWGHLDIYRWIDGDWCGANGGSEFHPPSGMPPDQVEWLRGGVETIERRWPLQKNHSCSIHQTGHIPLHTEPPNSPFICRPFGYGPILRYCFPRLYVEGQLPTSLWEDVRVMTPHDPELVVPYWFGLEWRQPHPTWVTHNAFDSLGIFGKRVNTYQAFGYRSGKATFCGYSQFGYRIIWPLIVGALALIHRLIQRKHRSW